MRIGLHYSFQVAPGESSETVIRDGLEDIKWADANGFSSVVFASHHFFEDNWIPRPIQLATAAAAVTRNVRVGTDIIILPLHHPVAVAEEAALCDMISGGRFILGVGLGWQEGEYAGFGVPYRQRARIYERSIDIIQRLLKGETVSDRDGHIASRMPACARRPSIRTASRSGSAPRSEAALRAHCPRRRCLGDVAGHSACRRWSSASAS